MANELDTRRGPSIQEGFEPYVVDKELPVEVGVGSVIFEIALWVLGIIPGIIVLIMCIGPAIFGIALCILGTFPGIIFLIMKVKAKSYFKQLAQRIQANASTIANYQEQRVVILSNCVGLLDKAIDLDKSTFAEISANRSGINSLDSGNALNKYASDVDRLYNKINVALESYPELRAHSAIEDAMQQNSYLQREITAAREVYNDSVYAWNRDIYAWPTKMIVAARNHYTTRIPFETSAEVKEQAKSVFF